MTAIRSSAFATTFYAGHLGGAVATTQLLILRGLINAVGRGADGGIYRGGGRGGASDFCK